MEETVAGEMVSGAMAVAVMGAVTAMDAAAMEEVM